MPTAVARERTGLCSVTLRKLGVEQVARCTREAGLRLVEWGGDLHAPPEDEAALRAARAAAARHGLVVCSYGSYLRAGVQPTPDAVAVLRAAAALGAPRVRVWAGATGSALASSQERRAVVRSLRAVASLAADAGLEVALEHHDGTLADTADATRRLLEEVDRPDVTTYWQPPVGLDDDDAVAGLELLADRVSAVHVFSWWPGHQRRLLVARAGLWRRVLDVLELRGRPVDLLLEFVPGDDPAILASEAAALHALLGPDRNPHATGDDAGTRTAAERLIE